MKELPRSSKVVVIGGGVIGCSVAYHLNFYPQGGGGTLISAQIVPIIKQVPP